MATMKDQNRKLAIEIEGLLLLIVTLFTTEKKPTNLFFDKGHKLCHKIILVPLIWRSTQLSLRKKPEWWLDSV